VCHTYNGEESFAQVLDSIIGELETVLKLDGVVDSGSIIYDGILTSKVLH